MKHILFLFTTLVLFSSLSCENDPTTTIIEGHVLQKESLAPIANAKLLIYQDYSKGVFQGIVEWPIDTVFTNNDGYFKWETDIDPYNDTYSTNGAFFIKRVDASDHFGIVNNDQVSKSVYHLDHHKTEIIMAPHAYLTVNVTNEAIPETNYCKFFLDLEKVSEEVYGENESFIFRIAGNTNLEMNFTTDSGLNNWTIEPFQVSALDTISFDFIY